MFGRILICLFQWRRNCYPYHMPCRQLLSWRQCCPRRLPWGNCESCKRWTLPMFGLPFIRQSLSVKLKVCRRLPWFDHDNAQGTQHEASKTVDECVVSDCKPGFFKDNGVCHICPKVHYQQKHLKMPFMPLEWGYKTTNENETTWFVTGSVQ